MDGEFAKSVQSDDSQAQHAERLHATPGAIEVETARAKGWSVIPVGLNKKAVASATVFTSAQEGMEVTPTNASLPLHADAAFRMPNPRGDAASLHSFPPGPQFAVLRI